jgi:putative flippase GtrA
VKKLLLQKKQFLLYCVIGASGATLDFATYSGLLKFTGLHYQAANAIGYTAGTSLSFLLNARYNFCVRDWLAARFVSFFGVAVLGWATSAALLQLLVGHFHFDQYLSKLAALCVVVLLQYNLNRLLSFRKTN